MQLFSYGVMGLGLKVYGPIGVRGWDLQLQGFMGSWVCEFRDYGSVGSVLWVSPILSPKRFCSLKCSKAGW